MKNIPCKLLAGAGLHVSVQQKAESPGVSGARKNLGHLDGSVWKALSFTLMWVFQPICPRATLLEDFFGHISGFHLHLLLGRQEMWRTAS